MSSKIIYLFIFIGGTIGGYLPTLFGISSFSFTSVICGGVGSVIGLWIGYKISN